MYIKSPLAGVGGHIVASPIHAPLHLVSLYIDGICSNLKYKIINRLQQLLAVGPWYKCILFVL